MTPCATAVESRQADLCAEPDLDESRALETLMAAVNALTAVPGHPATDRLVQDLQILARACRRRAQALQAVAPHAGAAWPADHLLLRAELLANNAEDVAVLARTMVLGGDPVVLDRWLFTQLRAAPGIVRGPGGAAVAVPPGG